MRKQLGKKILGIVCAVSLAIPSIVTPMPAKAAAVKETVTQGDNTTTMAVNGYSFNHSYVKPGDTLKMLYQASETATAEEVKENVSWTVKKVVSGADTRTNAMDLTTIQSESVTYEIVATASAPTLTIKEEYLECLIYGEIGETKLTIYCSKTPVIYINSETEYYDVTKEYTDEDTTTINLVGNDTYSDESYWYNGTGEVKIRGNSTAYRPKRPFKLKLSEKADLLGLGTQKNADGEMESFKRNIGCCWPTILTTR